ncbi:MAG TPA: tripartite tricarboxylate transporter permease, partial [Thermodesulfobacteriota bacterium]|nr:tripartite tricarboxylate transporter permease [Thermodesulfobacteriota bacterium]
MSGDIFYGFSVILTFSNLCYCFSGAVLGTLVGVLPGLGPVAAMSLLFPVTLHIPPVSAIIMLAGIYYGAMYGGSTTSILVNIPGEAASAVTCIDGYQMARQGRAGVALGISAFGSFIGGTLTLIVLQMIAPPLAQIALAFGFPEYFALMCCGLVILTFMARGSIVKALMMAVVGIFLGTVGTDLIMGAPRFTFGIKIFMDGMGIVPVIMGLFGISEVLLNIEEGFSQDIFKAKISNLLPTLKDWRDSIGAIFRGTLLGFFFGILPGAGTVVSGFTSYAVEKKLSKHPEKFGTGMIQAVAGPETANNAAVGGAFIPLLSLGIPTSAPMALLLGCFLSYGVQVGPLLMKQHGDIFWGVVASMYIGNIMLLILNLPLIGLWVKILKVPYGILFPLILLFCVIGAYSLNNTSAEVILMIVFGGVGYLMKKFDYDAVPLIMAMVLSPMMENSFRQSLLLSYGSVGIFFTRPIACAFMVTAIFLLILPNLPWFRARKWEGLESE